MLDNNTLEVKVWHLAQVTKLVFKSKKKKKLFRLSFCGGTFVGAHTNTHTYILFMFNGGLSIDIANCTN